MAVTPGGMPYPIGTDRVADGDNAIEALARAITKPVAATFSQDTGLWASPNGPPKLTRVAGRWLLQWTWANVAAGTFGGNAYAILGSVPAVALPAVAGIRRFPATIWDTPVTGPARIAGTNVQLDASGSLAWWLPQTYTNAPANGLSGSCSITWDAEAP